MFVEHPHTYQGSGVGYMSIDTPGLAVPKGRCVVEVEPHQTAVCQHR